MGRKKKAQSVVDEVKAWLRENAPQVKTFIYDEMFNQTWTLTERKDKGPKGYEIVELEFDDFDAIKKHYGGKQTKKSVSGGAKPRASTKASGGTVKKALAGLKSKKR